MPCKHERINFDPYQELCALGGECKFKHRLVKCPVVEMIPQSQGPEWFNELPDNTAEFWTRWGWSKVPEW
jgi:hypothetical protein